jgi:hypothetical protein
MKKITLTLFLFIGVITARLSAQNVGINATGSAPDASAMLDVSASDKGILIPRVSLTATNNTSPLPASPSPATGLLVYNTATAGTSPNNVIPGFYYWNGSAWVQVLNSSSGVKWNSIIAPDGNLTLSHSTYTTNMNTAVTSGSFWTNSASAITTGKILDLNTTGNTWTGNGTNNGLVNISSSSAAGTGSNSSILFNLSRSGANSNASHSAYGIYSSVTNTGTTNANYAGFFSASGASSGNFGVYGTTSSTTSGDAGVKGVATAASGPANGVVGTTSSSDPNSTGVFGSATQGVGVWGKVTGNGGWGILGDNSSSGTGSQYGVYARKTGSTGTGTGYGIYSTATGTGTINYGGYFTASGATTNYGIFTPNNSAVRGYLEVGSPTAPASNPQNTSTTLYTISATSGLAWSVDGCNTGRWYTVINNGKGYIQYDNIGTRSRSNLYSPYVWIPTGSTNLILGGNLDCSLEDGYDGLWIEYTIDGGSTWTKITSFNFGGYPDNANGSNTACSADEAQNCWNGSFLDNEFRSNIITGVDGKWFRFRLVGVEDGGTATGDLKMYGIYIECNSPASVGGSFASGNIYAEKNVYAGSNVLLGDVAEYFKVDDKVEPGDLISLSSLNANTYIKTRKLKDANVIGVVSTAPTLTINQPDGVPVGLTGRVPVKVTNENGEIKIGDYLTASSTPGHAMKASGSSFVIGKALDNFREKEGKILCLIANGWVNPNEQTHNVQSGGNYFIPKGMKSVIVRDESVSSSSRVFITMLSNAGSHYWLGKKLNGLFEINLEQPTKEEVYFDYFIDNANVNSGSKNEKKQNDLNLDEKINLTENPITDSKLNRVPIQASYDDYKTMPPTPPDPSKSWEYVGGKFVEFNTRAKDNPSKR